MKNNLAKLSSETNTISQWEFLLLSNLAWMKIKKSDIKACSKVFEQFDLTKNGFIDQADFQAVMKDMGLKTDKASWGRVCERINQERNNHVGFNEFVPLCVNIQEFANKSFIKELF